MHNSPCMHLAATNCCRQAIHHRCQSLEGSPWNFDNQRSHFKLHCAAALVEMLGLTHVFALASFLVQADDASGIRHGSSAAAAASGAGGGGWGRRRVRCRDGDSGRADVCWLSVGWRCRPAARSAGRQAQVGPHCSTCLVHHTDKPFLSELWFAFP